MPGVVTYITPSTTSGLACIVERSIASPVRYVPGRLEAVHVGRVDLRELSVLVGSGIAAIDGPIDVGQQCRRTGRWDR